MTATNDILSDVSACSSKEVTIFLLKLAVAGVLIGAVFVAPGLGILAQYFPNADRRDRQRIKRHLSKLEQSGFIKYDKQRLETRVVLTQEGDVFMNEQILFDLKFERPSKWDKEWFVVMFDIPARKGKVRHLLRLKLLEIGFIMYQGSVYIFPYKCPELIRDIEKILGVKKCIQTMTVKQLSGESSLIKHFKLS